MTSSDLYQRVEQSLRESYPPSSGNRPPVRKAVPLFFPVFADYVREKGAVLGRQTEDLEDLFKKPVYVVASALAAYTLRKGKDYGVYLTSVDAALERAFGRFGKIAYSENLTGKIGRHGRAIHKHSRNSRIFYSSEEALKTYIRAHVTRTTETIRGINLVVLNCNFNNDSGTI